MTMVAMVISNSLCIQERWHLDLSSACLSRECLNRDYIATTPVPCFHSSPSLFFSPSSNFAHLQPETIKQTTNRNGFSKLNCHNNSLLVITPLRLPKRRGDPETSLHVYEQHSESTATRGAPVADNLPRRRSTAMETRQEKRQRQKHAHHQKQSTRAPFPNDWVTGYIKRIV